MNKIKDIIENIAFEISYYSKKFSLLKLYRRMRRHGVLLKNFRINIKTLPASWIDSDGQILHVNFQILTEFVEEECSHMAEWCGLVKGDDLKLSKKEKAIMHMDAYINSEPSPQFPDNTDAWSKAYSEIKDLYIWWTVTRPSRDNGDNTDSDIKDRNGKVIDVLDIYTMNENARTLYFNEHPEVKQGFEKWSEYCQRCRDLEIKHDEEDTHNLIRLIKVREYMWT